MGNDGFKCYTIYVSVIAHYSKSKYNITEGLLNQKKLIQSWNNVRFDSDGILFESIANKFPPSEIIRLFSYYFYYNQEKTHPSFILNDGFNSWFSVKEKLKHPVENYIIDIDKIKSYCVNNKIKMRSLLNDNSLFSLNLSFSSILILNQLFDIQNKLQPNNELESKIVKRRKLYLNRTGIIFTNYIKNYDWKGITKDHL